MPTDFSKYSEEALQYASNLAEQSKAELHLIHVLASASRFDRSVETQKEKRRKVLEKLAKLLKPHAEMKLIVNRHVVEGAPANEIRKYAQRHDIDLIVMGTQGRTGLVHAVMGSVAEKVLRLSACPVLVVRAQLDEAALPWKEAAQILQDHFGDTVSGDHHQTRAQMKGRLMRELAVSEVFAEKLIEYLESAAILHWIEAADSADMQAEGHWQIQRPFTEMSSLASGAMRFVATPGEDSPAFDLLQRALALRATDIHIDPMIEGDYLVRLRIDGRLETYCRLDHDVAEHLTHQFRMLANLELVDRFRPQEGRMLLPPSMSSDLEVRITTSPVAGGDATALRLFSRDNVFLPLSHLGFAPDALAAVEQMLRLGEGIVLVTGPTGTGKSTTVYSMLEYLGSNQRNIVSIEDPVEFAAPFVRQMSVDESHGVTMTSGLRTILRMDPDIVFVGEIRDAQAAEIAMRAAASGRHVFSTLHTRDVAATVTAIRDLDIDKRSLAGNLRGIINQRLLRRLCTQCRERKPISDEQREAFSTSGIDPPAELLHPRGCDKCRGTGYHGRTGVFEAVVMFDEFAQAIMDEASEDELRRLLRSRGTSSLTIDALKKVRDGVTSLKEAIEMHWI